MKTATIAEAEQGLAALIDLVRGGETVVITDGGVAVARVTPCNSPEEPEVEWIGRLEREGIISRPSAPPTSADVLAERLLGHPPSGVLDALLEERRTGR